MRARALGRAEAGHGSDPNSRSGISPTAGPGGAGNAPSGTPPSAASISAAAAALSISPASDRIPPAADRRTRAHAPSNTADLRTSPSSRPRPPGAHSSLTRICCTARTYTTYFDTSLGARGHGVQRGCHRAIQPGGTLPLRSASAPIFPMACRTPAWSSPARSMLPET